MDCAVDSLKVGCHNLLSAAAKLYRVVAVERGWCSRYAGVGWCLHTIYSGHHLLLAEQITVLLNTSLLVCLSSGMLHMMIQWACYMKKSVMQGGEKLYMCCTRDVSCTHVLVLLLLVVHILR